MKGRAKPASLLAVLACAGATQAGASEPPAAPLEAPQAATNANSGCFDDATHPTRRRPGHTAKEQGEVECDPNRLPTPDMTGQPPPNAQDRWRIVDALGFPS